MALRNPPSWLQNALHPAENDRLTMQAIWASTGIIGTASCAVTASSPAAMTVEVASGWGVIVGNFQANMGVYNFYNDATVVLPIAIADPVNPRIDRIVVTIQDSYYTGSADDVIFQVLQGTPAASPVAPAIPTNSISFATVTVGATVTQINTGNITDTRVTATTQLPIGDITEVQGGAGISVSNGTGPIPVVAVNSSATLSAQDYTVIKTNGIGSVNDYSTLLMMGAL